jgi:hypothetical protein
VSERIYPGSRNSRKSDARGYRGALPPALEPLRAVLVERDRTINALLAARGALKAAIEQLELQHAELEQALCDYAEAKLIDEEAPGVGLRQGLHSRSTLERRNSRHDEYHAQTIDARRQRRR